MEEITEKRKNSNSNVCPLCDGLGNIIRIEDGQVFAKVCECTKQAILMKKISFANIPEAFKEIMVNDFKANVYQQEEARDIAKIAKNIVKNYILDFDEIQTTGKGLYFYSDTKGSGKTMLAIALANALMNRAKIIAKYARTVDILSEIRASFGDDKANQSEIINEIKNIPILIIDDIGVEKVTGWVNEILYQIIDYRYTNKLVTIFTSNTHFSRLQHDKRLVTRIRKMSMAIQMPEESIRDKQGDEENAVLMKKLLRME